MSGSCAPGKTTLKSSGMALKRVEDAELEMNALQVTLFGLAPQVNKDPSNYEPSRCSGDNHGHRARLLAPAFVAPSHRRAVAGPGRHHLLRVSR